MKIFELNNKFYSTDLETINLLKDILKSAKNKNDYSAFLSMFFLGLKTKRIKEINGDKNEKIN